MSNSRNPSLHQLFEGNQQKFAHNSASLIAQIHSKLSNTRERHPFQELKVASMIKFIQKHRLQDEEKSEWQRQEEQQSQEIDAQLRRQAKGEISELETEIPQLEKQIASTQESYKAILDEREKIGEKIMALEKQQLLLKSKDSYILQNFQKNANFAFTFSKGEHSQPIFQQQYLDLVEFMTSKLETQLDLVKYYHDLTKQRFRSHHALEDSRHRYDQMMEEKAKICQSIEQLDQRVEEKKEILGSSIKKFYKKVDQKVNEELEKQLNMLRPRKQDHQRAFWQLREFIESLMKSLNGTDLSRIKEMLSDIRVEQ